MNWMYALAFVVSLNGYAGHELNNGADAVVCRNGENIESVTLLDVYEMKNILHFRPLETQQMEVMEIVDLAIDRLSQILPVTALGLKGAARAFESEANFVEPELVDVDDSQHPALPRQCSISQLVNQQEPQFPLQPRYLVQRLLWEKLDSFNQAATILHELFYRRKLSSPHSLKFRYLTGLVLSKEWQKVDRSNKIQLLSEILGIDEKDGSFNIGRGMWFAFNGIPRVIKEMTSLGKLPFPLMYIDEPIKMSLETPFGKIVSSGPKGLMHDHSPSLNSASVIGDWKYEETPSLTIGGNTIPMRLKYEYHGKNKYLLTSLIYPMDRVLSLNIGNGQTLTIIEGSYGDHGEGVWSAKKICSSSKFNKCPLCTAASFHKNGQVKRCKLHYNKHIWIGYTRIAVGRDIEFHDNGMFKSGSIINSPKLFGPKGTVYRVPAEQGLKVHLDRNGHLTDENHLEDFPIVKN